jgi:xanthine permease
VFGSRVSIGSFHGHPDNSLKYQWASSIPARPQLVETRLRQKRECIRALSRYDERTVSANSDRNEDTSASHLGPRHSAPALQETAAETALESSGLSGPSGADELVDSPDSNDSGESIDAVESVPRLLCFGMQHVLVMYAGTVAVPLILGSALRLTPGQVIALISADLFTSGLATLLQTLGWWKFGARLPLIQGCSFICVAPMILIGGQYGITTMYGAVICCGLFTMLVGPLYSRMLRFFPPVVIGSVITVIGLSLLPVAGGWLGGGDSSAADFGSFRHLGLGLLTIVLIVLLQRFGRGMIGNLSVLLGLVVGTALAAWTGQASFAQVGSTPWFAMARPMLFGWPQFALLPSLVMCVAMLVVMTETTGNCLAIGEITGRKIGPATLTAAFRADGLSTMLGGFFNSFPYNVYSQNTGLLKLSKVKSRYAVAAGGGLLVLLGFLPKLAAVIAAVPRPVLGGASIVMFGMTAMAGIEELARVRFQGTNNAIVVAISISLGVLPIATPQLFAHAPDAARLFLNSGIFLTAASAVLLNLFFSTKTGSRTARG